jgi:hypothetical protein
MSTTDSRRDYVIQVKTTKAMDPKIVPFPTERLFLRSLVKTDFESCRAMLLDEETIMYAGIEGIVDEETAREWFDALEEWPTVAIFLKTNGVLWGVCWYRRSVLGRKITARSPLYAEERALGQRLRYRVSERSGGCLVGIASQGGGNGFRPNLSRFWGRGLSDRSTMCSY